jgi:hypothetical protein
MGMLFASLIAATFNEKHCTIKDGQQFLHGQNLLLFSSGYLLDPD